MRFLRNLLTRKVIVIVAISPDFQAQLDRIEAIVNAIKASTGGLTQADVDAAVASARAEDTAALKTALDSVDPTPPAPAPAG